jgi:serine O-acetyltransferase
MGVQKLQRLKLWLSRLWVFSPERLWLASAALHRRGHWVLAFALKQLNSLVYRNSLSPGATVAPDIHLGHNSIGVVVSSEVEIGRRVIIWQNVTLAAGRPAQARSQPGTGPPPPAEWPPRLPGVRSRIVIEDGVTIGANAVLIAPRGGVLRVGKGARIGAGTVLTVDVPAGASAVGPPARILVKGSAAREAGEERAELEQPG